MEVGISVVNCARLIFMQLWHLKYVCCQQLDVTLKDLNLYLGISQLFLKTDGLYQVLMRKKEGKFIGVCRGKELM